MRDREGTMVWGGHETWYRVVGELDPSAPQVPVVNCHGARVPRSWGGMLATDYALEHPAGLRGIVVADSPARMTLWVSEANRLREALPPDVQEAPIRRSAPARSPSAPGTACSRTRTSSPRRKRCSAKRPSPREAQRSLLGRGDAGAEQ
jgi:pimeloyl-ACP methyl ester carboxylesterase